jgi:hypothetical protein
MLEIFDLVPRRDKLFGQITGIKGPQNFNLWSKFLNNNYQKFLFVFLAFFSSFSTSFILFQLRDSTPFLAIFRNN